MRTVVFFLFAFSETGLGVRKENNLFVANNDDGLQEGSPSSANQEN